MVKQFELRKTRPGKNRGKGYGVQRNYAKTVDEAITKACLELGTSSDNLEIGDYS